MEQYYRCTGRNIKDSISVGGVSLKSTDHFLLGCASCGVRYFSNKNNIKFIERDLNELELLELDDSDTLAYINEKKLPPLKLPVDEKGTLSEFFVHKLRGVYKMKSSNKRHVDKYFHLHPEFVEYDNASNSTKAMLCEICNSSIKKYKVPEHSLASGIDFGNPYRINLTIPNVMERAILARVRNYCTVLKVQSKTVFQKEGAHRYLKSHAIAFDHDAPSIMQKMFTKDHMCECIKICFVGPKDEMDSLAAQTWGSNI